jgi:hypothetical protein
LNDYPQVDGPDTASEPALEALVSSLRRRHRDAVEAVLVYGSCLRSGDIYDGLLDLYLLCRDYRSAYGNGGLAWMNRLLPPNVFYAEIEHGGRTLRAKVTVISLRDFQRGCSRAWFQSYIWGRFSQPTRIAWCRDAATRNTVRECLLDAAYTLLHNSLPALPPEGTLVGLWEQALGMSYGTELRTERPGRTRELVSAAEDFYRAVTLAHQDSLVFPFRLYDGRYDTRISAGKRRLAKLGWHLRMAQGKTLSVLRLVKALFTFEGGLDYIAWKLERHSGEPIDIPDRVRRRPLLYMWGFFWGLYRRGIFR